MMDSTILNELSDVLRYRWLRKMILSQDDNAAALMNSFPNPTTVEEFDKVLDAVMKEYP